MRFSHAQRAFTLGLVLVLCTSISGCRYLIPEDPSAPRYNDVLGGKRVPERNQSTGKPQASMSAPTLAAAPVATAPVYYGATPEYPPVSDETRALAAQRFEPSYTAATPPGMPVADDRSFWDRMAFWREDEGPNAQAIAREQAYLRKAPIENTQPVMQAPMLAAPTAVYTTPMAQPAPMAVVAQPPIAPQVQMASVGYPQLSNVPAAPMSDAARMQGVRAQLEQDRYAASQASQNLARQAAQEPSLLSTLPAPPSPMMASPAPPMYQAPSSGLEPIRLTPPQTYR